MDRPVVCFRAFGAALLATVAVCISGAVCAAEPYPAKTVRIVVPFPAGGSTDLVARNLAQRLSELWGQPVVVENRAGVAGVTGSEYVAKAAADGYTLLVGSLSTHAVAPSLYGRLPYDPVKDFAHLTELVAIPNALSVHPSIPARSVKELVALAKARPGQLSYASNGSGTSNHLATELFKVRAGINLLHVPYKGSAPALIDLLGGHISMMLDVVMTSQPHIKTGKIRGIACTGLARSAVLPDLPTVAESGYPGFDAIVWLGYFGPAGLPQALAAKLNADAVSVLNATKMKAALNEQGWDVVAYSQTQFTARIRDEIVKWRKVVQDSGARVD
jgi:tripartite-type tricarboxylate transporter receptor subunit TctC